MRFADGSHFEGEWINGKRQGAGLLITKDGKKIEGQWKDDHKI